MEEVGANYFETQNLVKPRSGQIYSINSTQVKKMFEGFKRKI